MLTDREIQQGLTSKRMCGIKQSVRLGLIFVCPCLVIIGVMQIMAKNESTKAIQENTKAIQEEASEGAK